MPTFIDSEFIVLKDIVLPSIATLEPKNLDRLHVNLLQHYQPLVYPWLIQWRTRQQPSL